MKNKVSFRTIKLLVSFYCLFSGFTLSAQKITQGEPVLVYALPKTEFVIQLETEKTIQKPGVFYRYAERYLATNNVITEPKTLYQLKNIKVIARAIPDEHRTFSIPQNRSSQASHIVLNSQGILCGVNVLQDKMVTKKIRIDQKQMVETVLPSGLLPLGEEYMMAGSEAKLAEGAAKQIYHIRESRLSLLTGDIDKLPADGASMKTMLDGMNQKEQEFTELFIGKTTRETQVQTIVFSPTASTDNQLLFRFSTLQGVVASNDLSGAPYYVNLTPISVPVVVANEKSNIPTSSLNYILPAVANLSINNGLNTLYSGQFTVPQLGVIVPVSDDILKQPNVKISIDPQTGRLISIK